MYQRDIQQQITNKIWRRTPRNGKTVKVPRRITLHMHCSSLHSLAASTVTQDTTLAWPGHSKALGFVSNTSPEHRQEWLQPLHKKCYSTEEILWCKAQQVNYNTYPFLNPRLSPHYTQLTSGTTQFFRGTANWSSSTWHCHHSCQWDFIDFNTLIIFHLFKKPMSIVKGTERTLPRD